ncbi:MAG: tetraacyldisaccharide 4'-kinase [Limnobacter sp.]|nr:tetraacyldisaccharide 4'-kinase [Limnobacter sp.]
MMPANPAPHAPKAKPATFEKKLTDIWYEGANAGWLTGPLALLSLIYRGLRWATQQHSKALASRKPTQPPVLVVGNLIAGGAGKTPVVLAVCETLKAQGLKVGIVSRGYGKQSSTVVVLSPGLSGASQAPTLDAKQIGDEPAWLLEQTQCPIAVGAQRKQAYLALIDRHPDLDLVVSDDGLQHHKLERTLEWVVFDDRLVGNRKMIPAGPLREPLTRLHTVDAILASNVSAEVLSAALGKERSEELRAELSAHIHEIKVVPHQFRHMQTGRILSISEAQTIWATKDVCAFAGLGNPNKFFKALKKINIPVGKSIGLPDHFDYPAEFCESLPHEILLTTGKDAVKLPLQESRLWVVDVKVTLPPALIHQLENAIGRSFGSRIGLPNL